MNYLLNVDFLEFLGSSNIHLNNFFTNGIYKISNDLKLHRVKDYGYTKQSYPYCFKIYYSDNEIGFLYTKTMDFILSSDLNIVVRINNNVFYQYNLTSILKKVVDALVIDQTRIKRLDICYDTDTDILSNFKTLYYDNNIKFKSRFEVKSSGEKDKMIPIGSIKSRVKSMMIYNKTLELNKSSKYYIRTIHRKVFGYKNIYRIELRIMSKLPEIKDIDLMSLGTTNYLETIYKTYFDDIIYFEDTTTKKKINFITLSDTGKTLDRIKRPKNQGGGSQIKGIINTLDKEIKTKEFRGTIKNWKVIRAALLKKYELETWYLVKK